MNVLGDAYVSGIVAHLSKGELEKYDAEHGIDSSVLPPIPIESQGKLTKLAKLAAAEAS